MRFYLESAFFHAPISSPRSLNRATVANSGKLIATYASVVTSRCFPPSPKLTPNDVQKLEAAYRAAQDAN